MAHDRIEINPEIMGGKPVIRGTRIPVETVLRKLGAGMMFWRPSPFVRGISRDGQPLGRATAK